MTRNNDDIEGTRYHKEIGFPEHINLPTGTMMLYSTKHARREAQMDRYGSFDLPLRQDITQEMYERNPKKALGDEDTPTKPHIFEITVIDGEVETIALRKHLDDERDKVLIINPEQEHTVTAWSNLKEDSHETLQTELYKEPDNVMFND